MEYEVSNYKWVHGTLVIGDAPREWKKTIAEIEVRIKGDGDKELCSPITLDSSNIQTDFDVNIEGNQTVRVEWKIINGGDYEALYLNNFRLSMK